MMLVGLTGGIASGKTTASNVFSELGVQVIDTDVIAHALLVRDSAVGQEVISRYGKQIVRDDGRIDRSDLRQKVAEADELQWLESLLHPLIRDQALAAVETRTIGYAVLVVPLLFEAGFDALVDTSLVVDIDEQTQWNRSMARPGMEEEHLRWLLMRQFQRQQRLDLADRVIDGAADICGFRQQVTACALLYAQDVSESNEQ